MSITKIDWLAKVASDRWLLMLNCTEMEPLELLQTCSKIEGKDLYETWLGKASPNLVRLINWAKTGNVLNAKTLIADIICDLALLLTIAEEGAEKNDPENHDPFLPPALDVEPLIPEAPLENK
jgi:hypothetical protein